MHRPIPLLPAAALPAGTAAGLNDGFCSDCFAHAVAWAVENAKNASAPVGSGGVLRLWAG